ncbi:MAG: hypothetical protein LBL73_05350 [Synergistaceae bacterium]|jgi:hypothetical protein|nr:hypothetical protein [Synergistaceae bacterium]
MSSNMEMKIKQRVELVSAEMRSAGQDSWSSYDMQDLCEMAGLYEKWLDTVTRIEEEAIALEAAKILCVEIRHYIPADERRVNVI